MNNFTKCTCFCLLVALSHISFKSYAQPTMSAPTVTSITTTGATLGGTIAGAGITARGTSWSISTPVVATDHQLAEGGTTAGTYTHARTSMPSGTLIYFVAYGTNAGGTAISAESSFYTLSAAPSGQPGSFTATGASSTQVNLNWSAVTADGFLIYRKSGGTAPNVAVDLVNGTTPPSTLTDGSTLINTATGASTSYNNTSLSAATQYSYTIVPFGYDGTHAATYNFLTASAKSTSAYTFSAPPSGQPSTFTATGISSSQINLSWGAVTANGFLIYRKSGGTAPDVTVDFVNGTAPPATLTDGSTLINTASGASVSYNNTTGLSAGTQYSYTIVPFGYDGSNNGTYNYLNASAKSANSFTLSAAPVGQPGSFSTATASGTQINLTFTAANNGGVAASGYVIYRIVGSTTPAITAGNLPNAAAAPASLPDGSTLVTTITSNSATSYNDTGVSVGNQYSYAIVPYGYNGSNASTYNYLVTGYKTSTSYTTLPTLTTPTAVSINDVNADLGATITSSGNNSITERGTVWKTSAGVSISDNKLAEGSTAVGTFSHTRNSLPPGTQIFYRGYATTVAGSGLSPESSFYTLSVVPDNQPGSVTATAVSATQINLTFPSFSTLGNANAYIILRRIGSDPSTSSVQDGVAPASLTLGSATLVTTISSSGTTSYNDTGLTAGTNYHYAVVPYNWDGVHSQTINYKVGSGFTTVNAHTFDNSSTITLNTPDGTTSSIDYASFQDTGGTLNNGTPDCVSLGKFKISDLGGGDGVSTILSSITFSLTNSSFIKQIAIFDASGTNRGQTSNPGATLTFSSLSGISASDGNSNTFEIWATFQQTVTDQQYIVLTITSATASSSGSGFSSFSANTGATNNKISVNSNQFAFFLGASQVASLPNTSPNTNFGPLTIKAVDGFGNIQLARSSAVTLSLSAGTGTLDPSPGALSQNLSSGVTTFSNLKITAAGAKTIKAQYALPQVASAYININISSPGVKVTAGAVSTSPLCYSGDYQSIDTPIKLEEQDPGDFTSGGTFSIVLPTGFIFDTSITGVAPSITGNEINTISNYSYPATNTVQFSYNISGTTNPTLDKITISGLKIKYTGTSPATNVTAVRFGGTAVQVGNATSDSKVYLTISSAQTSSTVVDFGVNTIPGQTAVNSTDTRFQVGTNSVQLVGNPSGGVFSGPGVSPNGTYGYIFSPSSVGVSTGNQIVYTYTDTSAPHCQVTHTKSFDVYASIIVNLNTKYCNNGNSSTGLNVLQVDVDNYFPPANSNAFYDVVYLYSYTNSTVSSPGPTIGAITTTNTTYTYTTVYNYIGTTTAAVTIVNEYVYNNYLGYTSITYTPTYNTVQGSVTTFDPSQSYYRNYYAFGVYVYFRARNVSTNAIQIGGGQFVTLTAPPNVTFSIAKTTFCDYDAAVSLVGSPTPQSASTDNFTGGTGIGTAITSPSSNNWLFTPANIGTKSALIDVTYSYRDPATNCSNFSTQKVKVNPQPAALTSASVSPVVASQVNLNICEGSNSIGSFSVTPASGPLYKWYADAALTQQAGVAGSTFTPPTVAGSNGYLDVNTVQSVQYYVTQTTNGCESPGFAITATVNPKVTISTVNPPLAICQGGKFDLSTMGVSISGGTTSGTWSNSGGGTFTDAGGVNPSTAFSTARFYAPSATEQSAGSASITITSANPAAPSACTFVSSVFNIPISQAISVSPITPIAYCPGQNSAPIPISTVVSGGGVATATWSSALALGKFQDKAGLLTPANPLIVNTTSGANVDVVYIPFVSEINSSTDIVLNDVKVTSNATGTCAAASQTTTLSLSASPTISVGVDQTVCADQTVTLTGSFGGKATKATWTTSGSGTLANTGPIATIPTTTNYTMSSVEKNNSSDQVLVFTLTSDAPTAPCVAAQKSMNVTVHPIPLSPVVNPITFPNSQPAFCVNDPLSGYSVGATVGAVNGTPNELNWYSNASASGLPLVTNNNLNLVSFVNTAIPGTYTFWATQKTVYGCESKAQLLGNIADPAPFTVTVNPNPQMSFTVKGNGTLSGLCFGDQTNFDASSSSISAGSIASYQWDFADLSIKPAASASPLISYTYKNIGTYNVSLTGVSDKLCKSTVNASSVTSVSPNLPNNSVITIGPYPIADFSVLNQCLADNTQFTSIDTSSPKATISTYAWDFGDGNTSSVQNPAHVFGAPGFYNVSLTETSNLGCVNGVVKKTYVLPTISFTGSNQFTYNESFENNNVVLNNNTPTNYGAWAPEAYIVNSKSSATPSWNLLPPDGGVINVASAGSNAWVAGLLGTNKTYNTNETSVLNSPCFDISGLQKPVISFDYFSDTWSRNDGVYIQYSVNNGVTWNTLGKKGKGLNWYSNNFITGLSGSGNLGQSVAQEGWDGQSGGWITARYSLSNVPGLAPPGGPQPIRFRLYFGSQGNTDQSVTTAYNGFALDNVFIQNSNRTVLAENFTNSAATGATINTNNFLNFETTASQLSLVKIQYHTSIGGNDIFNEMNPVDPQARAGFYGVTSSFHGYIDGNDDEGLAALGHFNGVIKPGTVGNPDNSESYYDSRTLVPAPLTIGLNASVAGDSLIVNGAITVLPITIPSNNHQYVIQMAIVEDVNGQFIVRKLIKDASGKALTALAPNATQSFTYSWKVPAFSDPGQQIDPSKLSAVCFVQDLVSKDVLQTNIVKIPTVSLVTAVENLMEEVQVYPNPSDKEFQIQLPVKADKQLGVKFFNQLGQSVISDAFNEGEQSKTISTQGLSDGMYILQIGDKSNAVRKKILVVHK
jgi:hypothetical protein